MDTYLLRCISCGTRNRIPAANIGKTAKCGKCGGPVDTEILNTAHPLIVTDRNFQERIMQAPLPVLLDCWAPWCGPCQMMGPLMDQLAAEWKGRVLVCKLNVDENPLTSDRFQIRSVPTLLIFDRGQLQNSLTGALPKHQIAQAMKNWL